VIAPCAMRRRCPSAICIRQAKTVAVAHRSGIDFGRKGPSKLYVEEARVLALSCAERGRWGSPFAAIKRRTASLLLGVAPRTSAQGAAGECDPAHPAACRILRGSRAGIV
jgi:hypothetical protein